MRRPSIRDLSPASARAAVRIAERLSERGQRAWIVGGAVRDLALGVTPKDVDLASAATPEEIERLFERTLAVGKAFGTVVVVIDGQELQVTTFRSERGFSDARRPDAVVYGATPEEDARRRDFTCNALYLDPLTDELLDPEAGLVDLERRLLRCIGVARERFREDGLRLVRMARLAAAHELEIEAETWSAARASLDALEGLSGERFLAELQAIFAKHHAARALRLLDDSGTLERVLPGLRRLDPLDASLELREAALASLEEPVGVEAGFAVLLDPDHGHGGGDQARALALFERLKPSRTLRDGFESVQRLLERIVELERTPASSRASRVLLVREAEWSLALRVARAWRAVTHESTCTLDELERFERSLDAEAKFPTPWITSDDLARIGVERGPRWGSLLREAETRQLDRAWTSREEALAWLALQVGGNTRRSADDNP